MVRRPRRVRRLIAAGVRAVVQQVRTAVWLHVGLVGPRCGCFRTLTSLQKDFFLENIHGNALLGPEWDLESCSDRTSCVCVCVRERECDWECLSVMMCLCACVCVCVDSES